MRCDKLLVAQIGDALGSAAGGEAVAGVRVHEPVAGIAHDALDIGVCALHLAEHDAVVADRAFLVKLVVPALLHEYLGHGVDARTEHRIEIHAHEVEKILLIAA